MESPMRRGNLVGSVVSATGYGVESVVQRRGKARSRTKTQKNPWITDISRSRTSSCVLDLKLTSFENIHRDRETEKFVEITVKPYGAIHCPKWCRISTSKVAGYGYHVIVPEWKMVATPEAKVIRLSLSKVSRFVGLHFYQTHDESEKHMISMINVNGVTVFKDVAETPPQKARKTDEEAVWDKTPNTEKGKKKETEKAGIDADKPLVLDLSPITHPGAHDVDRNVDGDEEEGHQESAKGAHHHTEEDDKDTDEYGHDDDDDDIEMEIVEDKPAKAPPPPPPPSSSSSSSHTPAQKKKNKVPSFIETRKVHDDFGPETPAAFMSPAMEYPLYDVSVESSGGSRHGGPVVVDLREGSRSKSAPRPRGAPQSASPKRRAQKKKLTDGEKKGNPKESRRQTAATTTASEKPESFSQRNLKLLARQRRMEEERKAREQVTSTPRRSPTKKPHNALHFDEGLVAQIMEDRKKVADERELRQIELLAQMEKEASARREEQRKKEEERKRLQAEKAAKEREAAIKRREASEREAGMRDEMEREDEEYEEEEEEEEEEGKKIATIEKETSSDHVSGDCKSDQMHPPPPESEKIGDDRPMNSVEESPRGTDQEEKEEEEEESKKQPRLADSSMSEETQRVLEMVVNESSEEIDSSSASGKRATKKATPPRSTSDARRGNGGPGSTGRRTPRGPTPRSSRLESHGSPDDPNVNPSVHVLYRELSMESAHVRRAAVERQCMVEDRRRLVTEWMSGHKVTLEHFASGKARLLKFPMTKKGAKAQKKVFTLDRNSGQLFWGSGFRKRGSVLPMSDVKWIVHGPRTHIMKERLQFIGDGAAACCFSIVTKDRTIDLQAHSPQECEAWIMALQGNAMDFITQQEVHPLWTPARLIWRRLHLLLSHQNCKNGKIGWGAVVSQALEDASVVEEDSSNSNKQGGAASYLPDEKGKGKEKSKEEKDMKEEVEEEIKEEEIKENEEVKGKGKEKEKEKKTAVKKGKEKVVDENGKGREEDMMEALSPKEEKVEKDEPKNEIEEEVGEQPPKEESIANEKQKEDVKGKGKGKDKKSKGKKGKGKEDVKDEAVDEKTKDKEGIPQEERKQKEAREEDCKEELREEKEEEEEEIVKEEPKEDVKTKGKGKKKEKIPKKGKGKASE
eukprot:TRINITY_DN722_c0_g1_i6.p1 TRINITY_DN722_c0_g1~~TRINITY_DN722_c0_g1_i6.p1  ORF type:complete len:1165 (-),score=454.58 TRINITY_DN722_c0_g1_i6:289-3714(-)